MEITNVIMIELIEFVLNWWIIQHLAKNCHGMRMGVVFGTSQANRDGTGRTKSVLHPILVIVGVFVCGPLPI